jgi:hypothetical protein
LTTSNTTGGSNYSSLFDDNLRGNSVTLISSSDSSSWYSTAAKFIKNIISMTRSSVVRDTGEEATYSDDENSTVTQVAFANGHDDGSHSDDNATTKWAFAGQRDYLTASNNDESNDDSGDDGNDDSGDDGNDDSGDDSNDNSGDDSNDDDSGDDGNDDDSGDDSDDDDSGDDGNDDDSGDDSNDDSGDDSNDDNGDDSNNDSGDDSNDDSGDDGDDNGSDDHNHNNSGNFPTSVPTPSLPITENY